MGFCIEVSGDYACFTRPEMKVERVSYDVITPSAARAIFEAILWKPAIQWNIHKIEVLKPIRWVNIRRNEVGSVLPVGNVNKGMKGGELPVQYIEEQRQQRAGLILKDVAYRLHASFDMTSKADAGDNPGKFAEMFKRRAKKGQCFNQPYLGCREFSCEFRLIEEGAEELAAIPDSKPLGWMLYDMDYQAKETIPLFFNADMQNGVIQVPAKNSEEVRG
ncbi:type I-C CRISPR-associated protein Cas5c [Thalassolituus oleivorans]|jgi:CRISPR-associated protein Cas5d|uniref:pre-crRNA processing endonuclease n=1 Tax=Thalassolituus oleivorans MIL-1 TaxID=1298593 RepID=M5E591_9GAMM|nr:type I-C CRISPR-associated protein Cas5c [Thalassolituus oleivorans]CCU72640.1 CRISPR-associated protein, Csd5d family [Thalassolituus oleivorans MIL-1]